ncbi:hypothetical protein F4805DRAFT_478667 [Annulohypoxylon moriforme]|nr:hypothetical protein F4805DRAFT_478667 [Annulohypoxylon moriforme]
MESNNNRPERPPCANNTIQTSPYHGRETFGLNDQVDVEEFHRSGLILPRNSAFGHAVNRQTYATAATAGMSTPETGSFTADFLGASERNARYIDHHDTGYNSTNMGLGYHTNNHPAFNSGVADYGNESQRTQNPTISYPEMLTSIERPAHSTNPIPMTDSQTGGVGAINSMVQMDSPQTTAHGGAEGERLTCRMPGCSYQTKPGAKARKSNLMEHEKYVHCGDRCMFPECPNPTTGGSARDHLKEKHDVVKDGGMYMCSWTGCSKHFNSKVSARRCLYHHNWHKFHKQDNQQRRRAVRRSTMSGQALPTFQAQQQSAISSYRPTTTLAQASQVQQPLEGISPLSPTQAPLQAARFDPNSSLSWPVSQTVQSTTVGSWEPTPAWQNYQQTSMGSLPGWTTAFPAQQMQHYTADSSSSFEAIMPAARMQQPSTGYSLGSSTPAATVETQQLASASLGHDKLHNASAKEIVDSLLLENDLQGENYSSAQTESVEPTEVSKALWK